MISPTDPAHDVLRYCRQRGFPHYNLTKEQMMRDFEIFKRYDISQIIEPEKTIKQTQHCAGVCWSYFPHHWEVRTRKLKTPMDVWNNDELLLKAIQSRIKWGGQVGFDGYMSDTDLRKAVRTYSGVQRVSNFRPSAAAGIYHHYCKEGSTVWDMSAGFGGRMLGAVRSGKVKTYIGTDPSTPTFDGLQRLAKDFGFIEIILQKSGSENWKPDRQVDLCFTSPPYFNTEVYSSDPEQSCHKFTNVELWNEGFLRQTIKNCKSVLKADGLMILNVANVITHKTLESDTIRIAQEEGFNLKETLQLKLSHITKGGYKFEPTFVFELSK
jgi:hypothetical protein